MPFLGQTFGIFRWGKFWSEKFKVNISAATPLPSGSNPRIEV